MQILMGETIPIYDKKTEKKIYTQHFFFINYSGNLTEQF